MVARIIDIRGVVVEIAKIAGLKGSHAHLSCKLSQLLEWIYNSHYGIRVIPVIYGDISVTAKWVGMPATV